MTKRPTLLWTQDPAEVFEFLRQVRIDKQIMGKTVAEHLGHTPGFWSNVESSRVMPSTPTLFRAYKFLDLEFMLRRKENTDE